MKWQVRRFKKVSMIGRVAYALACTELIANKLGIASPELARLLAVLWSFTGTDDLGDWEENVNLIAGDILNHVEWLELQRHPGIPLPPQSHYFGWPEPLLRAVDIAVSIGKSELYGTIKEYGQESIALLGTLLGIVKEQGIHPPDLSRFATSRFTEERGWGLSRPREYFMGPHNQAL
jgi:hypothetical protein